MNEMPHISTAAYSSTGLTIGDIQSRQKEAKRGDLLLRNLVQDARPLVIKPDIGAEEVGVNWLANEQQEKQNVSSNLRIVKVIIADPNENIPLNNRIIYNGEETVTDLTDQELYFEVDMKGLLERHNAVRTMVVDKKASAAKQANVMLEPVRVRDLKMVVVEIAKF